MELAKKIREIDKKAGKGWALRFENADSVEELLKKTGKAGVDMDFEIAEEFYELLKKEEVSRKQLLSISGEKLSRN